MAIAFRTERSRHHESDALKMLIARGLKFWIDNDFVGENWHDNQITTPRNLVNLMLLIGDQLPAELVAKTQPMIGRANMRASGARPSGDRIVIAGIHAKNLLFTGQREDFDAIAELIEGEMKFSTGSRGLQRDYSFHHRVDRVNNTVSYGYKKYANAYGEWACYFADTRFAFAVSKINLLVDYYLDGICKQLVYGIYTDISVKNRSISREQESDFQPRDTIEIERLLALTGYRHDELERILRLRRGEEKPSASFSTFFWQTEHFVFQRPKFYTTVRMFSSRNRNMEQGYNGDGTTIHHRADGTNHVQLRGDEYHAIWPVYDWQKIPGATILQKPELPRPGDIQKEGATGFVGAVSDGLYGAVAFDFLSPHDQVAARKAWFFFDEEYVCLGANIQCRQELPVATTVNQTLMRSDVSVCRENAEEKLAEGTHELEQVNWVHQDRIGYVFPEPATVMVSNQVEEGRWSDITLQKGASRRLIQRKVFALWIDHGIKPDNEAYQYIVVPDVTRQELAETSPGNRAIGILANTADLQAVTSHKLNLCQLAFYRPGEIEITSGLKLRIGHPGMVMLRTKGNRIQKLSASDPSRGLHHLVLTVSGIHDLTGQGITCVPDHELRQTTVRIELPQGVYAGKSVTAQLREP